MVSLDISVIFCTLTTITLPPNFVIHIHVDMMCPNGMIAINTTHCVIFLRISIASSRYIFANGKASFSFSINSITFLALASTVSIRSQYADSGSLTILYSFCTQERQKPSFSRTQSTHFLQFLHSIFIFLPRVFLF